MFLDETICPFKVGQLIRMRANSPLRKHLAFEHATNLDAVYFILSIIDNTGKYEHSLRNYAFLYSNGTIHKSQWNRYDEYYFEVVKA